MIQKTPLKRILIQNHSRSKKNNFCGHFMSSKFKIYLMPLNSIVKFRLTCIYTACKAEENHVSAEELDKGIEQDHQMILNYEMIVLQSLGFDLIVYATYRSLEGFVNEMEDFVHANDDQLQKLKDLHKTAKMEADKIVLTDAPLLFPPWQLALAALRRSNEVHGVFDFERYLGSIVSRQLSAHAISELTVSPNARFSAADMKHIDRKLKSCRNPGSHEKSKKRKRGSKESSNKLHDMP